MSSIDLSILMGLGQNNLTATQIQAMTDEARLRQQASLHRFNHQWRQVSLFKNSFTIVHENLIHSEHNFAYVYEARLLNDHTGREHLVNNMIDDRMLEEAKHDYALRDQIVSDLRHSVIAHAEQKLAEGKL